MNTFVGNCSSVRNGATVETGSLVTLDFTSIEI